MDNNLENQNLSAIEKAKKLKAELLKKKEEEENNKKQTEQNKIDNLYQDILYSDAKLIELESKKKQLEDSKMESRKKRKGFISSIRGAIKELTTDEETMEILKQNKEELLGGDSTGLYNEKQKEIDINKEIEKINKEIQSTKKEIEDLKYQTPEATQAREKEVDEKILESHTKTELDIDRYQNKKGEVDFHPNILPEMISLQEKYGRERVEKTLVNAYQKKVASYFDNERKQKIGTNWQNTINVIKQLPEQVAEAKKVVSLLENKLNNAVEEITAVFEQKPYLRDAFNKYGFGLKDKEALLFSNLYGSNISEWKNSLNNFYTTEVLNNKGIYIPEKIITVVEANINYIDALVEKFKVMNEDEVNEFYGKGKSINDEGYFHGFRSSFELKDKKVIEQSQYIYSVASKEDLDFIKNSGGVDSAQRKINEAEKEISDKQNAVNKIVEDKIKLAFLDREVSIKYKKDVRDLKNYLETQERMVEKVKDAEIEIKSIELENRDLLDENLWIVDNYPKFESRVKKAKELSDEVDKLQKEYRTHDAILIGHIQKGKPSLFGKDSYDKKMLELRAENDKLHIDFENKQKEYGEADNYNIIQFNGQNKVFEKLGDSSYSNDSRQEFYKFANLNNSTIKLSEYINKLKEFVESKKNINTDKEVINYVDEYNKLIKKTNEDSEEFRKLSNNK